MKAWLTEMWRERTGRERRLVIAGAALLVTAFAYAYVWMPMAQERERLLSEVPQLRAALAQMRADAAEIERLRTAPRAAGNLKAVLQAAAAPKPSALDAEPDGRVRVVFASVPAHEWLAWAARLHAEQGIRIETARIEPLEEPGMVRVTATFSGAGS